MFWDDQSETEVSTDDATQARSSIMIPDINLKSMFEYKPSIPLINHRGHKSIPLRDVPSKEKYKVTKSTFHNGVDCCHDHMIANRIKEVRDEM